MRPSPPHLTAVTASVWLLMEKRQRRAPASHTLTVLSRDALAKRSAPGLARCSGSQDCDADEPQERVMRSASLSGQAVGIALRISLLCLFLHAY